MGVQLNGSHVAKGFEDEKKHHPTMICPPYEQEAPTMWQHKQSIRCAIYGIQMMMGAFLREAFQRPKQRDARKSVIMAR